ncbi:unnamed protein product [Trichobilharzia szidati]|nr:unnamed protein product [Trichobilharzia szidati]
MSGFSFGKPATTTTTSAFSFGSSPFGTSAGAKPAFGIGATSNPLFSPTVTSNASSTPSTSSLFQSPLSLTSTTGNPATNAATTQSGFGLPSFPSLAKPSTPASGFGLSTNTSFGLNASLTPSTQSSFGQLFTNPASSLMKPTTTTATATTSSFGSPFSFGSTAGAAVTSQNATTTAAPIGFGALPSSNLLSTSAPNVSSAANTSAVSQPATTSITFGFGLLSNPLSSTAVSTVATPATVASSTPFSFGKPDLSATATSTVASGFGVSSLGIMSGTSSSTAATSITTATSFGGITSSVTSLAATTTTTSVPSVSTATATSITSTPQTLTYNQLEDLVNKWTLELEEQERYFLDEAERINQWDQTLITNAESITSMYEKVETCQCEQSRLEQELDFIEGQQRELESLLEPLERAVNELPPGHLHSDYEREAIFQLATNVDLELGQLLSDLREIADQTNSTTASSAVTTLNSNSSSGASGLNASSSAVATPGGGSAINSVNSLDDSKKDNATINGKKGSGNNSADVMNQITRILNCHMHSLNWIHHNTQEIMDRLKMLNGVS